jgi:small subunit ribosomal protein S3
MLKADVILREWLTKKLKGTYVDCIDIERSPNVLDVIVKTSRPGLIIGRKGEGADKLKKEIIQKLQKAKLEIPREVKLTIEEVRFPESRANIVAQMVTESLEKRMPFRRVMKQTVEKVMNSKDVKGVKIALSGRLGGAEMSRREWLRKGRIPLQTLRANIDFAKARAHLPYGDLGIKVWVFTEQSSAN